MEITPWWKFSFLAKMSCSFPSLFTDLTKPIMKKINYRFLLLGICAALGWTWATPMPADSHKEKAAYLGVQITKVDQTLRQQLKLPRGVGLKIVSIVAGSPAEKAELKEHDVLRKLDDQILFNEEQFAYLVRTFEPGTKVHLTLLREGTTIKVDATLAETELGLAELDFPTGPPIPKIFGYDFNQTPLQRHFNYQQSPIIKQRKPKPMAFLGVELKDVASSLAARLGLEEGKGVLVNHVQQDSPAKMAGLKKHDVILQINNQIVEGTTAFVSQIQKHKKGDVIRLNIRRGGRKLDLEATLSERRMPEPDDVRSIFKQYGVPRLRVMPSESQDGATLYFDNLDSDSVIITTQSTSKPLDQSKKHVVISSAVSSGTGGGSGSGTGGKHKSAVAVGIGSSKSGDRVISTSDATTHTMSVVKIRSDEGTACVKVKDGHRSVVFTDPEDKIIFEGPVNTPEEKAKLPPKLRQRLKDIDIKVQQNLPKPNKVEKMRIMRTDKKPRHY